MTSHDADERLDANSSIILGDAYIAMYYFVSAYWERGGKNDGSVTLLRHAIGPEEEPGRDDVLRTTDPALWDDWIAAVKKTRSEGMPTEL
jgi:hypothetical protein